MYMFRTTSAVARKNRIERFRFDTEILITVIKYNNGQIIEVKLSIVKYKQH